MAVLRLLCSVLFAAAFACVASAPLAAQAQTPPAPEISEALSADIGKLRTFADAKDYASALALLDRLLPSTPAAGYDRYLLSQFRARILLEQNRYAEAIAPLETALALADTPGFATEASRAESLFLLAQLHHQRAAEAKDAASRRSSFDRAAGYLARWESRIPKPTTEGRLFAADLAYRRATLDPDRPDAALLDSARRAAEDGLALRLDPPSDLYTLLLASLQQRGENARVAEILELRVARKPDDAGLWRQLVSTYLALAADAAPDEREIARQNLRALLAIERAQDRGLLATPADRFNRVALLVGLRRFDDAAVLLEKGLADGTLDNNRRNWELLISAHQQAGRSDAARVALEKAVRALPDDARLEFSLAQFHYADGRLADTRRHLENALAKPSLENPGQALLFLAYVAYEQKDYAYAERRVREAASRPDAKKEDIARLSQAIAEASKK